MKTMSRATEQAQSAVTATEDAWKDHRRNCSRCARHKSASWSPCKVGARLWLNMKSAQTELRDAKALDNDPTRGMEPLF